MVRYGPQVILLSFTPGLRSPMLSFLKSAILKRVSMIDSFRYRRNGTEGIALATLLTRIEIMFYPWEQVEQAAKQTGGFLG
jgi:hypothetical protein